MSEPRAENVPPPGVAESPGYDLSGIHVPGILVFLICFALAMAGILAYVWRMQGQMQGAGPVQDMREEPGRSLSQPLQPSPEHPTLPWQDLAALRASQEAFLHSAGKLEHDPAHRHIPIDQAMDQLLKSGTLSEPWKNPATQPYLRPPAEKPATPSVENRT
ncbi:MAG TPA: hypothetical protein VGN88_11440 [Phycisphaerae bacterium]|jgi:hypothetical protein